MDDKLSKALEFVNFSQTLAKQKQILKDRYEDNLVCFYQGKKFKATKELIAFCQVLKDKEREEVWLVDDNGIPIKINDLDDFMDELLHCYFFASNEYFTEYSKLATERSINGLLDE